MAETKAAEPKKVRGIRVRSIPESFCRAGRRWTREPQEVPVAAFSQKDLRALREEPLLFVEDIEITPPVEGE